MLSVTNIELPAVPRAGDDTAVERAFPKRATLVRADSVQRQELASYVEQGHDPIACDILARLAGGAIRR